MVNVIWLLLLTEEHSHQIQNRLPLLVGSIMGGAAFLLVVTAIVVVVVFRRCFRTSQRLICDLFGQRCARSDFFFGVLSCGSKRRESPYSNRLQRYISNRGNVALNVGIKSHMTPCMICFI